MATFIPTRLEGPLVGLWLPVKETGNVSVHSVQLTYLTARRFQPHRTGAETVARFSPLLLFRRRAGWAAHTPPVGVSRGLNLRRLLDRSEAMGPRLARQTSQYSGRPTMNCESADVSAMPALQIGALPYGDPLNSQVLVDRWFTAGVGVFRPDGNFQPGF